MHTQKNKIYIVGICIALFSGFCHAGGISNNIIRQDDDLRILERNRQKALQESLQTKPEVLKEKQSFDLVGPILGESPCFDINEINIDADEYKKFSWLLKYTKNYNHQCLGEKSLERLQSNLNNKLLEVGYATTRIHIPEQDLSNGKLKLNIQVGRINKVTLEDHNPLDFLTPPWATWRNALPIAENDILNLRDLDQGLEQLERLPSQKVNIILQPADKKNTSNIIIKRYQEKRIRAYLSLDNSGSKNIGRGQSQLAITADSPLGLNDQLSLSASSNIESVSSRRRNQSVSAFYQVPFGYHTFTTSFSYSRFGQNVQGTTLKFLSSGYSQNANMRWHTTLHRNTNSKLGVYGQVSTRRARSYIEDVELQLQKRRTSAAELGLTFSKKWQKANIDLEVGYSSGVSWFEAEPEYIDSFFSDKLTTRPKTVLIDASLNVLIPHLDDLFAYHSRFYGQHTARRTLSINQFSIGSRYSVRGFDGDTILQSESGYAFRNELRVKGFTLLDQIYMAPYLAVDIGHLWGPSSRNSPFTTLVGGAFGLRAQTKHLYADLSLGLPIKKPSGFKTKSINPMLQITLNI